MFCIQNITGSVLIEVGTADTTLTDASTFQSNVS